MFEYLFRNNLILNLFYTKEIFTDTYIFKQKLLIFFQLLFQNFFSIIQRFALCERNIYFEVILKFLYQLVEKKC